MRQNGLSPSRRDRGAHERHSRGRDSEQQLLLPFGDEPSPAVKSISKDDPLSHLVVWLAKKAAREDHAAGEAVELVSDHPAHDASDHLPMA